MNLGFLFNIFWFSFD